MNFVKKDWQFRDVISESELNRMEDGIEEGITKAEQAQDDLAAHTAATTGVHGATSAATANSIVQRDSAGRAKFAAPSASDDAANKQFVEAITGLLANLSTTQKANLVAAINEVLGIAAAAWNPDNLPDPARLGQANTFTQQNTFNRSNSEPGVVVNRTNHSINAVVEGRTSAGSVIFGHGDSGYFAVGDEPDIRYAENGVFRVNTATGDVETKGNISASAGVLPLTSAKSADAPPNDYPDGLSIMGVTSQNMGWPNLGAGFMTVFTAIAARGSVIRAFQLIADKTSGRIAFRPPTSEGAGWGDFVEFWTSGNAPSNVGATSGYQILPSGLIIQWGRVTNADPFTDYNVTFPITFPNYCYGVQVTAEVDLSSGSDDGGAWCNYKGNSSCTLRHSFPVEGTTGILNWFALGR